MATERQNTPRLGRRGWQLFRPLGALLSLATAGCAGQGLLYTRVVSPYSQDFHGTSTGSKTCRVNEHNLKEPFTSVDVSVLFSTSVVAEAAQAAGMTNLYYADLETLSVLKGIYERKTLIRCGD